MNIPCRVLLVDDHQMFLDGLVSILSGVHNLEVVGTSHNGREALRQIEMHVPDVVLTDLQMPEMDGVELVRRIKSDFPTIKILVLSMMKDRDTVTAVMEAEAEGFLLKSSNKVDLLKAIQAVHEGETYYSNEILSILVGRYQQRVKQIEAQALLSDRELQILQLVAEEFTSDQIGERLFISPRTVETHRRNILAKTQCTTLIGLIKFAVKNDLVSLR